MSKLTGFPGGKYTSTNYKGFGNAGQWITSKVYNKGIDG